MENIRDFIYLDNDRMYSMFSQIFKGITENIIKHSLNESSTTKNHTDNSNKKNPLNIEEKLLEASFRTENKILHDYAYNILEEKITDSIYDATNETKEEIKNKLSDSFIVKIKGNANIHDYLRLRHMMTNYESMVSSIAYFNLMSITGNGSIDVDFISERLKKDRSITKDLKERLSSLVRKINNPKEHAKDMGLLKHAKGLEYVNKMLEILKVNNIDISIQTKSDFIFRGILDKHWLRLSPELLMSYYGTDSQHNWTMIGNITHVPKKWKNIENKKIKDIEITNKDIEDKIDNIDKKEEETTSLRDRLRDIFTAVAKIDELTTESIEKEEAIIIPIAIYRDYNI